MLTDRERAAMLKDLESFTVTCRQLMDVFATMYEERITAKAERQTAKEAASFSDENFAVARGSHSF